jgi:hypothetical protein
MIAVIYVTAEVSKDSFRPRSSGRAKHFEKEMMMLKSVGRKSSHDTKTAMNRLPK